ncbi:hypothetical protein C8R44DRAFT_740339 [Mycena epipterygia]|nr:hypothetical protein C8R44DRAFT_740339 [Mycena epipterygia]
MVRFRRHGFEATTAPTVPRRLRRQRRRENDKHGNWIPKIMTWNSRRIGDCGIVGAGNPRSLLNPNWLKPQMHSVGRSSMSDGTTSLPVPSFKLLWGPTVGPAIISDDRDTGTERRIRAKNKKQEAGRKKGGEREPGFSAAGISSRIDGGRSQMPWMQYFTWNAYGEWRLNLA